MRIRNFFKKDIRVAMVAPPFGSTGGPEVVVQNLTDELLKLGVDVTLFAPADWETKAKHIPILEKSIWNMEGVNSLSERSLRNYRIASQNKVLTLQNNFDVIHLHSQRYAYTVAKNLDKPCIVSFHNNIPRDTFEQLRETSAKLIALSNSQKGDLKVDSVIYNGVPTKNIEYSFEKGTYLMFVGRLADQKGVDVAIKIAKEAGKKLLIFGRVGSSEERRDFFDKKIQPFLDKDNIVYMGEVSHKDIYKYLKGAEALVFPIRRPEVFGMVAAEALACGTPLIGTKVAPLPELFDNKEIAFLSDDINELIEAAKNTDKFSREKCRKYAEDNFDSSIMADKYLDLYKSLI